QERQPALTVWAPGLLGRAITGLRAVKEALVPADRAAEAFVQGIGRAPAELLAGLVRVETLDRDLAGRDVLHDRRQRRAHQPDDQVHEIQDGELGIVRKVERLAAQPRPRRELLGQLQIRCRAVLDVEIVPDVLPIGADDRTLATDDRADRARDEAAP